MYHISRNKKFKKLRNIRKQKIGNKPRGLWYSKKNIWLNYIKNELPS